MTWTSGTDLRDEKGVYHWGGRPYVSVTTVLGALMSGDLAYVHSYRVADKVRQLVDLARAKQKAVTREYTIGIDGTPEWRLVECDPRDLLSDVDWLRHEPLRQRQIDMDRGTTVHEILPMWASGDELGDVDVPDYLDNRIVETHRRCTVDDVAPYVYTMLDWLRENRPKVIACDVPVFHDGLGYAGSLDAIWELDGRVWLSDLKTSKATAVDHACQIAAYRHAEYVAVPNRERRMRMPKVDGTCILLVQPGGKATYREWTDSRRHFGTFRHCLAVYRAVSRKDHAVTCRGYCTGYGRNGNAKKIDVPGLQRVAADDDAPG